jgi:hypothetical protein
MNKVWEYRSAQRGFPLALHSHGMEPNFVPTPQLYNSVCRFVKLLKQLPLHFFQLNQQLRLFSTAISCKS